MLEYFMKYIYSRDMIKLWEEFLETFKSCILLDKEKGYIYVRNFLWYSDSKLPEDKQPVLENIITKYLPREDKENIMRTIAQKYRDEGIQIGQEKGIQIGQEKGIQIGQEKGKIEIAKAMLLKGYPMEDIVLLTGLSSSHIQDLVMEKASN
ncbi:hypothetical protein DK880_00286 [Candidatus Cardinium hertigii]|uniref:Transposase n=2 Tax=Candidatus Cardinium hertigii TaxID=247481 RepID=A0A2Z3L7K4_9BACT|nr:hypothetical protein DK880_00286 [Candidatus Cardinium hertigii]